MLEYLGLSGGGISGVIEQVGWAFSNLVDRPWFWPGVCVAVVVIVIAAKR